MSLVPRLSASGPTISRSAFTARVPRARYGFTNRVPNGVYGPHKSPYLSHPLRELPSFHSRTGAYPNFTFIMCIQLCDHQVHKEGYYLLADAALAASSSRWVLESRNTSTCLIFRLPSVSVTMCAMKIVSKLMADPDFVFALWVIYRVGRW